MISCVLFNSRFIMAPSSTKPHDHEQLHVFFVPFMSPGHQIPMIDMARIFASRGVKATILTTPFNISRFESTINRDYYHHHNPIKLLLLNFPSTAANLPPNCENLNAIPSRDLSLDGRDCPEVWHPTSCFSWNLLFLSFLISCRCPT